MLRKGKRGLLSLRTRVWMPASDALLRPWTPGLLEMTTTISAELDGRLACSISACRLVPGTGEAGDVRSNVQAQ